MRRKDLYLYRVFKANDIKAKIYQKYNAVLITAQNENDAKKIQEILDNCTDLTEAEKKDMGIEVK